MMTTGLGRRWPYPTRTGMGVVALGFGVVAVSATFWARSAIGWRDDAWLIALALVAGAFVLCFPMGFLWAKPASPPDPTTSPLKAGLAWTPVAMAGALLMRTTDDWGLVAMCGALAAAMGWGAGKLVAEIVRMSRGVSLLWPDLDADVDSDG